MSEQIRLRVSEEEIAFIRRRAVETRQSQTEIIREAIKRFESTENFTVELAEMEQRIAERLGQLPFKIWQEIMHQTAIAQKKQGDKK